MNISGKPVNNYETLINKLDEFIRKYYKNQLLKGCIYAFGGLLTGFLVINLLEYFGQFSTTVRTFLISTFVVFAGYVLVRFIIVPLAHLFKFGKIISYEQASQIIGMHFNDVKDKLLNTLQLQKIAGSQSDSALLRASIDQKIKELNPIPFTSAINLNSNARYLKFVLPSVIIFLALLLMAPSVITESTKRLTHPTTFYEKKAPFSFQLLNDNQQAVQNEDVVLRLKISGSNLPAEAYAIIDGNKYKMQKEDNLHFSYTLRNLQKNTEIQFFADGFFSKEYEWEVLAKPMLTGLKVMLEYPNYLNRKSETIENSGDLNIPAGTSVTWFLTTKDAERVELVFSSDKLSAEAQSRDSYKFKKRFVKPETYSIKIANSRIANRDSITYQVSVVADEYPAISTTELKDSLSNKLFYYKGNIEDDYGFTKLSFVYRFIKSADSSNVPGVYKTIPVNINKGISIQSFFYALDLGLLNISAEDELEYYFEVWDNDGVNGPKASKTKPQIYKAPGVVELQKQADVQDQAVKEKMDETYKDVKNLQKQIDEMLKKLADKKNLTWQDKKQIQELIDKQQEIQKQVEEVKKQNEKNAFQQNEFKKPNEDLLRKQDELQKLFEEVMTPEMKELFKQLQEMLNQNNKDAIKEQLEKMKLNEKDIEKQLDRTMELFKEMKLEQKMQNTMDELEKLAEEQKKLAEESMKPESDQKDLEKKQDDLNKQMDELNKQLDEIKKENEELETPKDLEDTGKDQQEIKEEQNQASENLNSNKKSKASQNQKNAAKKMQEMKDKLQKSMEGAEMKQNEEDYNALRQILENLVQLSFEQEKLMTDLGTVTGYNPKFVALAQVQKKLKDDAKLIEDSLLALSKRQIKIQAFINREITKVNDNMNKSLADLGDRNIYSARTRQQYVMTSVNNLAVMLSEVLKQMQEEMQQQQKGEGKPCKTCKKKGQGKPSAGAMRKAQEELNKQMKEMKGKMDKGQKPGDKGMSEEFAKMAAQQEALRRYMQQMQDALKKEGGTGNELGDLKKMQELMEQTEKELVYKKITPETMQRQQEILTRLLESEKAEKEREQDNRRESKMGKETERKNPPSYEEYIKQKNKEIELLRTVSPDMNPYYRQKVKDYFKSLEQK